MGFLSKEIIIIALTFAGGGFAAWNNVTTDVQKNTTTIEEQEKQNKERYDDLKDGQQHIQDLLEQLLLKERADEGTNE